jgi:hypothetical protein
MEALRRPDGLGHFAEISPLDLQIQLGEMEKAQGLLGFEAKMVLSIMKEMSAKLKGKTDGLETPEKIYEATRSRPIMDNFPTNKGILLSM